MKQTAKAMITYEVRCNRLQLEITNAEKRNLIEVCKKHNIGFISLLCDIADGQLEDHGIHEKWLYSLLQVKEEGKTLFDTNPIESRRRAISHSNSLNEVLFESDNYFSARNIQDYIDQYGLEWVLSLEPFKDGHIHIYTVSIWMLHAGSEYMVGSSYKSGLQEISSQIVECSLYKFYGYDMDGSEPYKLSIGGLNYEILPDAGKQINRK